MITRRYFTCAAFLCASIIALAFPATLRANNFLQLDAINIDIPMQDGRTAIMAMTVYMEVMDEEKVSGVCRSFSRLKKIFIRALKRHPIKVNKRTPDLRPVPANLETAATNVLGAHTIKKIHTIPGQYEFAMGTKVQFVHGTNKYCVAIKKIPAFVIKYEASLHGNTQSANDKVLGSTYPLEQGKSIISVKDAQEVVSKLILNSPPAPIPDTNPELAHEQQSEAQPAPEANAKTPGHTEVEKPPRSKKEARAKPDLAAEWKKRAEEDEKSRHKVEKKPAPFPWEIFAGFAGIMLVGGVFLGFGTYRYISDRRKKNRRRKERRRNFNPFEGDEQRTDDRRKTPDQRASTARRTKNSE